TDDLTPWLHAHRAQQALHSYYEPVRQRAPRRYSVPHGFRRPGRSLSPPTPGQPYRGTPSHVPRKSSRPGSRRLHAGHRLAGKRTPSRLIPVLDGAQDSDGGGLERYWGIRWGMTGEAAGGVFVGGGTWARG